MQAGLAIEADKKGMERLGERIYHFSSGDVHIIRVKSAWHTILFNLFLAAIFVSIIQLYWLLGAFLLGTVIQWQGHSDYRFDTRRNLFQKRYGIGRYSLGDSYTLKDLRHLNLSVSQPTDMETGRPGDIFSLEIHSIDQKVTIYGSADMNLIATLAQRIERVTQLEASWKTVDRKTV